MQLARTVLCGKTFPGEAEPTSPHPRQGSHDRPKHACSCGAAHTQTVQDSPTMFQNEEEVSHQSRMLRAAGVPAGTKCRWGTTTNTIPRLGPKPSEESQSEPDKASSCNELRATASAVTSPGDQGTATKKPSLWTSSKGRKVNNVRGAGYF